MSALDRIGARGWLAARDGPLAAVWIDGEPATLSPEGEAWTHESGLRLEHRLVAYEDGAVCESWVELRNAGSERVRVTRVDSISIELPAGEYEVETFTSEWGEEFGLQRERVRGRTIAETKAGRSSHGMHPWWTLHRADGGLLTVCVAWSGNWILRLEPLDEGGYRLSGGLHDWKFAKVLAPDESMESPPVALAVGGSGDLNETSTALARVGRAHWYARSESSRALLVEWNHWWPYEDKEIDEETFRANAEVAERLGLEICTLDAGWFGPTDEVSHWYDYRGDWDRVNTVRFPSGIRALADDIHARGMRFGIWCEIEAVGERAEIAAAHPEFLALRRHDQLAEMPGSYEHARRLGYLCFGCPAVQEWAFATLDGLIREYGADWIKLDFNLDPGAGCNRIDHGHGAGDGLFEHYRGYYRVLDRIRAAHPDVILENCSSGGLRLDLGLARHTHVAFLSDPDWPEHGLQLFWGASTYLAPEMCLHWGYSQWRTEHPRQRFDPNDPELRPHQVDYYVRAGMLGAFGFSQRLPELPEWVAALYARHTRVYEEVARSFVRDADLYRLTGQPERGGRGDRWAAFQYRRPDGSEHLVFAFRLPGGEPERRLRLRGLDPERRYAIERVGEERGLGAATGRDLAEEGLLLSGLPEEGSELLRLA